MPRALGERTNPLFVIGLGRTLWENILLRGAEARDVRDGVLGLDGGQESARPRGCIGEARPVLAGHEINILGGVTTPCGRVSPYSKRCFIFWRMQCILICVYDDISPTWSLWATQLGAV